jgi:hypothetical protein
MARRIYTRPNRPGRPPGPSEDRGEKPYDPRKSTARRQEIIRAVHRNRKALERGDITLSGIAAMLGTSPSYLSIVKNSSWGRRRLHYLEALERRDDNDTEPI